MKIKERYKENINRVQEQNTNLSKIIGELKEKNKELGKTISDLQNQGKTKEKVQADPIEVKEPTYYLFTCDICEQNKRSKLHRGKVNGLGIDPLKENKICDYCINKVDLIKNTEQEYKFE